MVYEEESIFNMALAYLKRIDKLLTLCDIHSMNKDIEKWNNTLLTLYREISIKLKTIEREDLTGMDETKIDNIENINLTEEHATLNNINRLINNPGHLQIYRKHILFLLHSLEIKMRTYMQSKSLLLPSKDDPRRAITRR